MISPIPFPLCRFMANKQPFVAVACMCEKVLREEGGVLSAIRILDTYTVSMPPDAPPGTMAAVELTALIVLKSGDVRGKSELSLRLRRPSGEKVDHPSKYPLFLKGEEQGAGVVVTIQLAAEMGYYELAVLWNGNEVTTMPFRLKLAPAQVTA